MLITYENYKLDEKYPEFRFQLQEYRDAMLLLAITRQKVWSKAESDSVGIKEAHDVIIADNQIYLMKNWLTSYAAHIMFKLMRRFYHQLIKNSNQNSYLLTNTFKL